LVSRTYTTSSTLGGKFTASTVNWILGDDIIKVGDCAFYNFSYIKTIELGTGL